MRVQTCLAALMLSIACVVCPSQTTHTTANVSGTWELGMKFPAAGIVDMVMGDMELTQTGSSFTGTIHERPIKGKFVGNAVTFTINFEGVPQGLDITFSGKLVDSTTMKGTVNFPQYGNGTWTATKH